MKFRGEGLGGYVPEEVKEGRVESGREQYRILLRQAQTLADSYHGTDTEYHKFFKVLRELEELAATSPEAQGGTPKEREEFVAKKWQETETPYTIELLIGISKITRDAYVRDVLNREKHKGDSEKGEHLRLRYILPPGDGAIQESQGKSEWEPRQYEERILPLIRLLESEGVFVDDIEIVVGDEPKRAIRTQSYAALHIPRLHRMVLVCDLKAEATFVVHGYLSEEILSSETKESLVARFPDRVRRVIHASEEQWLRDIKALLFDDNWGDTQKVSIDEQQAIRTELLEMMGNSSEKWVALGYEELRALRVRGRKIESVINAFGSKGKAGTNKSALALEALYLGLEIFGLDECILRAIEIAERTPTKWKEKIQRRFTAANLLSMSKTERKNIEIDGYKLDGLARRVSPDKKIIPMNGPKEFLEFLTEVYGEDNQDVQQEARRVADREAVKEKPLPVFIEEIKKYYPTERDWQAMNTTDQNKLVIFGIKYNALMSYFGVVPQGSHRNDENHRALGRKIYQSTTEISEKE